MPEYIIKLTKQEIDNLKVFLSRVQLTGVEALEFVKIAEKVNKSEVNS